MDRQDAALHAGRRPDLAAAAPRHLFDRRPEAAHPRPEERERPRPGAREARGRSRGRHGRRGCVEGARRRRAHLGSRRRHRRGAAHVDQARGRAVGARARGDATDAVVERPARPHRGAGRRPAEDRPRCRDRGAARRGGVRLRHRAARRERLHHDARLSPRHVPGRCGHPEPRAAQEVLGQARVRRQLLRVHRRGSARAPRRARLPLASKKRSGTSRCSTCTRPSITGRPQGLDLSPILAAPVNKYEQTMFCSKGQDHGLEKALDQQLIADARSVLETGEGQLRKAYPIRNVEPHRRHDARRRGDAAVRWRRAARQRRSISPSTVRRARASARSCRAA